MPIVIPDPETALWQGDPNLSLPGTGESVPGGIESKYTFNGITLNDRSVVDKYRLTEIGGFDDADVRDNREVNPGYHGETDYQSLYGGRTITLTGRLEAYSLQKMRDMIQAFKQAFSDLENHELRIVTNKIETSAIIACKKLQPIQIRETQTNYQHFRDFQVALRASNPRILSYLNPTFSANIHTSGTQIEVINKGNFRAQPVFKIFGPILAPTITNETNGEVLVINDDIPGEFYEIDIGKRTMVDQDGVNKFGQLDITSQWPELEPGHNTLTLDFNSEVGGVGDDTGFSVSYRHTWM